MSIKIQKKLHHLTDLKLQSFLKRRDERFHGLVFSDAHPYPIREPETGHASYLYSLAMSFRYARVSLMGSLIITK